MSWLSRSLLRFSVDLFMKPHLAHLKSSSIFWYRVELQAGHFFMVS